MKNLLALCAILLATTACSAARDGLGVAPDGDSSFAVDGSLAPDSDQPEADGGVGAPDADAHDAGDPSPDLGTPDVDAGTGDTDAGLPPADSGTHDAGVTPTCLPDETPLLGACWSHLGPDMTTGASGYSRCVARGSLAPQWRTRSGQSDVAATVLPAIGGGVVGLAFDPSDSHWHWQPSGIAADGEITWMDAPHTSPGWTPVLDAGGLRTVLYPTAPIDGYLCRRDP